MFLKSNILMSLGLKSHIVFSLLTVRRWSHTPYRYLKLSGRSEDANHKVYADRNRSQASARRFDDPERFARELNKLGFKASLPEQRGSFTYIEARKTRRGPIEGAALRFRVKDEQDG